jgi:hypothetical protein
VLTPIATDVTQGWIVLPDSALSLRERLPKVNLIEAMVTILPQYGQL